MPSAPAGSGYWCSFDHCSWVGGRCMPGAGSDGVRPVGHHPAAERAGGKGRYEERDSGPVGVAGAVDGTCGPGVPVDDWGRGVVVSVMVISLAPMAVLPGLYADPGDARARPLGHRSTAASGPHRRTVLVGAQDEVGRELRPPLGRVLPLLPPPVDGHVEQPERGTHHLVAPAGRPVRQVDLVLPPQVAEDPAGDAHGGVVEVGVGIPRRRVAHEVAESRDLLVRPVAEDGEGDPVGVEVGRVGGVLHRPGVPCAALALPLPWLPVVEHVAVDDQLVAPLEDIAKRDRAVGADHGSVGRHLCHGQPAPGRGDRVALAGVCLLALAQLEELLLEVVVVGDGRGLRGHGFLFQLSWEVGQPAAPTGTGVRSTWPSHPSMLITHGARIWWCSADTRSASVPCPSLRSTGGCSTCIRLRCPSSAAKGCTASRYTRSAQLQLTNTTLTCGFTVHRASGAAESTEQRRSRRDDFTAGRTSTGWRPAVSYSIPPPEHP